MPKQSTVGDFVQAYLLQDFGRSEKLAARVPSGSLERDACEAVLTAWRAVRLKTGEAEALAMMRTAQEHPPRSAELLQVVLIALTRLQCAFVARTGSGNIQRAFRLMKQLAGDAPPPLLCAHVLYLDSVVALLSADFKRGLELVEEACAIDVPERSGLWYLLRIHYAFLAMNRSRMKRAAEVLAELAARPPHDPVVADLLRQRQARLLVMRGQSREGLRFLDAWTPGNPTARNLATAYRVRLLLDAARIDEAQAALDAAGPEQPVSHKEFIQAKICLFRGDATGVREHARLSLDSGGRGHVLSVADNASHLAAAELAAGRIEAGKALLHLIDPTESDPDHAVLWAHVHFAEGRREQAARHFRRVLDLDDPRMLREGLRHAAGLNGMQIAALWTMAEDLTIDEAAPGAGGEAPAGAPARPSEDRSGALVGESAAMLEVRARVGRYAGLAETVLITGETGTGKDLVARLLHDLGPRAAEPFIAVNCAAISDTLIESELFGHVKGAFTGAERDHEGLFEAAGGGTVFLDEIASMSPRLQAALLRTLENREVRPVGSTRPRGISCRVIAASNRPLEELVGRGEFRSDLYYRLARLSIPVPPLRERIEDVAPLARHFLRSLPDCSRVVIGEDFLAALRAYEWPGNVRELRNEIERALLLNGGEQVLRAAMLSPVLAASGSAAGGGSVGTEAAPAAAAPAGAPALVRHGRGRGREMHERLARLRELFAGEPRLTRAEVVRRLGCAPNSATVYLRRLETEGLIERIETSGSLKTSYFVLRRSGPES